MLRKLLREIADIAEDEGEGVFADAQMCPG